MRSRGPIPTACRARRTDWSGIDDELRLVIIDVPQLVDLASNPNTFGAARAEGRGEPLDVLVLKDLTLARGPFRWRSRDQNCRCDADQ